MTMDEESRSERIKEICLETLGRLQIMFGREYKLSLVIRNVGSDEHSLMFSADEPGDLARVVEFLGTRERTVADAGGEGT
jgi:hypothetical protein